TGRPFEHGALPSDEGVRLGNGVLRVERWSTAYFTGSVVIASQFQIFFLWPLGRHDPLTLHRLNRGTGSKCGGTIMRKVIHVIAAFSLLLAMLMAARAADVTARPAPYAPPPPAYAPPPFSWTGSYIGGNIGAAWANRDVRDPLLGVTFNNGNSNGAFSGGG